MPEYILALDQGTTSSRAIVFREDGSEVSSAQKEIKQIFPHPGWVEHDPTELLHSQIDVARAALERLGSEIKYLSSACLTNQRETTLLWEKETGSPVYNAIVWQCRRSSSICDELKKRGFAELIHKKTGLLIDAYFSATKILWLFRQYPELMKRARNGKILFGTVDSWLLYNLTGMHLTDITNASRTMLFNINSLSWDEEILEELCIPPQMLPKVLPSCAEFGIVGKEIFAKEVPILGVAGDQQAALFGQGCFKKGSMKNTYGTGCFILMNTGKNPCYSEKGLITSPAWVINGKATYAIEGSVFIAGALIQWMRDRLKIIKDVRESDTIASSLEGNEGVYIIPAFVGLGAPHWNMDARGIICGLTRNAGYEHIVRAGLESIAYQSHDVIRLMEKETGIRANVLKADGGACKNDFLMQFQSDILGKSVARPRSVESTALGAFYLAGLKAGIFSGVAQIEKSIRVDREFHPGIGDDKRAQLLQGWERAVRKALLA
jgi:glycerol kinase